jgi:hypothetical protein
MNHYAVRQIKAGPNAGKWHYTCYNDRDKGAYPVGACASFRNCPDCDGRITNVSGMFVCDVSEEQVGPHCPTCGGRGCVEAPEAERCPGHDTPEEAYAHERQRLISLIEFKGPKTSPWPKHKCHVRTCQEEALYYSHIPGTHIWVELCTAHATKDVAAGFVHVGERWSS